MKKGKVIRVENDIVTIGMNNGSIKEVRRCDLGFDPVLGDLVEIFEDEDHHDVLSTLDQYINSEDEYTVRVRFDEDDYMYIEFQLDDGIIEIDENGWYVA